MKLKIILLSLIASILFTGCIGKIVSAPVKVAGEVIDIVLP